MLSAGDLKKGTAVEIDNTPCIVEDLEIHAPSARGAATLYKVRARNLITGVKIDKTYKGGEVFKEPAFEKRPIQFMYSDADAYHFMDLADYNQFFLPIDQIQNQIDYIIEGIEGIQSLVFNDQIIGIEMPDVVHLKIKDCDPGVRGNSATPRPKKAVLETNLVIQVPEHIESGELVRVDTRTGKFLGRAGQK